MSTMLYGIVSALNGGANFVVHVVFLVVVLTIVRSRRPDAWFLLAIAAGVFLVQTVMNIFVPSLVSAASAARGYSMTGGSLGIMAGLYTFSSFLGTIGWALLMMGLVQVASPPPEFSLNPPGG